MADIVEFKKNDLVAGIASNLGISSDQFAQFLIREYPGADLIHLLSYLLRCKHYKLDPIAKEIVALRDDYGRYEPYVTYDGWIRIMNDHPEFDGMEFRYSTTQSKEKHATVQCHDWVECVIFRKDRTKPTVVREFFDECYQAAELDSQGNAIIGNWQQYPKRRLRLKATMEGVRASFGITDLRVLVEEMVPTSKPRAFASPPVATAKNLADVVPSPALQPAVSQAISNAEDIAEAEYVPDAEVIEAVNAVILRSKQHNAPLSGISFINERFSGEQLKYALAEMEKAFPTSELDKSEAAETPVKDVPESDADESNAVVTIVRSLPSPVQF